jgi:hypothetical protein
VSFTSLFFLPNVERKNEKDVDASKKSDSIRNLSQNALLQVAKFFYSRSSASKMRPREGLRAKSRALLGGRGRAEIFPHATASIAKSFVLTDSGF